MKNIVLILTLLAFMQSTYGEEQNHFEIANNAVAKVQVDGQTRIYSFNGLKSGKSHKHVSNQAFYVDFSSKKYKSIQAVPFADGQGVLASIAATLNDKIYLFGGYTVAEDGSEVSRPEVFEYNPKTEKYRVVASMPTPVDDSVALVYQNRYIYLVSGWHNHGNVDLVQILDTKDFSWQTATAFPGETVFGQAAGIVGNKMLVVDGVAVKKVVDGKRQFGMANQSYLGEIDPIDVTKIKWTKLPAHPGPGRYRMAAAGDVSTNRIIFVGGSDNPYNFNGIGYNKVPSNPIDSIFAWDFSQSKWEVIGNSKIPTMDHRGLVLIDGKGFTLGGMTKNQMVIGSLVRHF